MRVFKVKVNGPRSFTFENLNLIFSGTTEKNSTKFCMLAFRNNEMKINQHDKSTLNIFFPGSSWPIGNLGMKHWRLRITIFC